MITAFTVKNFKAIGEEPVRIELKPITLLFGANSAGKSSILHALYYAYEVFNNHNLNVEKILLGENNLLDLGGFKRFVHSDNCDNLDYLNRGIVIRFDLDFNKDNIFSFFFENSLSNQKPEYLNNISNIIYDVEKAYVEVEISWRKIKRSPYVSRYETGINNQRIATIKSELSSGDVIISYLNFTHSIFDNFPKKNNTIDLLEEIGHECWLLHLEFSQYGALPENWLKGHDIEFNFETLLGILLLAPKKLVSEWLKSMCYLGPLREIPSRYSSDNNPTRYSYQPDCNSKRWATGLAAWDFLYWIGQQKLYESDELVYKELIYGIDNATIGDSFGHTAPMNHDIVEYLNKEQYIDSFRTINYWLSLRLDTGYEIEIELYREIPSEMFSNFSKDDADKLIEKILGQSEKIRIWLHDKSGRKLTPHEVGVGISQVLPVVVAAIGATVPLVVIEQPELHIHPAMQVQLGDLFITQFSKNKFFLIETHSEHLLLRILRRIRETAEGKAPEEVKLLPNEVAVYYVESENGSTQVNRIGLDENGRFTDRWPKGFFAERMREMLPSDIRERVEAKR